MKFEIQNLSGFVEERNREKITPNQRLYVIDNATGNILARVGERIDPPILNNLWLEDSVGSKLLKVARKPLSQDFVVFHSDGRKVAEIFRLFSLKTPDSMRAGVHEKMWTLLIDEGARNSVDPRLFVALAVIAGSLFD